MAEMACTFASNFRVRGMDDYDWLLLPYSVILGSSDQKASAHRRSIVTLEGNSPKSKLTYVLMCIQNGVALFCDLPPT